MEEGFEEKIETFIPISHQIWRKLGRRKMILVNTTKESDNTSS